MDIPSYLLGRKSADGGFGGLPTPSAASVGSTPVVEPVPHADPSGVIVPEQTVTWVSSESSYYLTTPVEGWEDMFVQGATVVWTFDGVTYSCPVYWDGGYMQVRATINDDGDSCGFWIDDGELYFFHSTYEPLETVTISLNAAAFTYQYGLNPAPGYDIVFACDTDFDSVSPPLSYGDFRIVSGSFDQVLSKFKSGGPIMAYVYDHYIYDINATYDNWQNTISFANVRRFNIPPDPDKEDQCNLEFFFSDKYRELAISVRSGPNGGVVYDISYVRL